MGRKKGKGVWRFVKGAQHLGVSQQLLARFAPDTMRIKRSA
jgi:hypothetical protein